MVFKLRLLTRGAWKSETRRLFYFFWVVDIVPDDNTVLPDSPLGRE